MMKKYDVTITRFGSITIEAESEEEAMSIVKDMETKDICWSEDWSATDARESEEN